MATEADLEMVAQLREVAITQRNVASQMSELQRSISLEGDINRRAAKILADKYAEAHRRNKMKGSDKAMLIGVLGGLLTVCSLFGFIAHNIRTGDAEKSQIILACTQSGGQWRSLGGQDDANKYDEVCVRSGK